MSPIPRPLILLLLASAAWLASMPASAQRTLHIPDEQLENIEDMPTNPLEGVDMTIDPDSPDVLRRMAEIGEDIIDQAQFSGTFPELVAEQVRGQSPIAREVPVVWELQVSGNWNETLRGEGALRAADLAALGVEPGHMITTVMRTDAREWPFMLGAYLPVPGPPVVRQAVTMPFQDLGARATLGLHGMTAHMFDPRRVDMLAPGASLVTERTAGHVRIDTREGAYRIHFSTSYRELDDGGRPTGRVGHFQGWICEAEAYRRNPDSCLHDGFQVVAHTPAVDRANVNPEYPALSVVFSDPAEIRSLADNFTLYTVDADGERVVVDGTWRQSPEVGAWREEATRQASALAMPGGLACTAENTIGRDLYALPQPDLDRYADPHEYVFVPSTRLHPGTIYEAAITGGDNGVRALHGDERLAADHAWRFATLLDLEAQHTGREARHPGVQSGPQQQPLEVAVYQTVRDPRLVAGKPALTRVYVDWSPHAGISVDWQPGKFEFELVPSAYHPRIIGQGNTGARQNRLVWLQPQAVFDSEDIRLARHTVNMFGWLPRRQEPDRLELVACPHDPFPFPMAQAETRHEHPVEVWDHDPGRLDFHYVVANTGDWSSGVPMESNAFIDQVMRHSERLVPQFLPYRSARSWLIQVPALDSDIRQAARRDMRGALGKIGVSMFEGDLTDDNRRQRYAAYIRVLQRQIADRLSSTDIVVLVLPSGLLFTGVPGTDEAVSQQGMAVSNMHKGWFKGVLDYRSGAVLMVVDAAQQETFPAEVVATGLVHEFGHVRSLEHNPGQFSDGNDSVDGRIEPDIDGFRLSESGLRGWNKSTGEGNGQSPDTLVSLMWPGLVDPGLVMLTPTEYATVQENLSSAGAGTFGMGPQPQGDRRAWMASVRHQGPGASGAMPHLHAAAWSPGGSAPLMPDAGPEVAGTGAATTPAPHLVVSGMIAPDGHSLIIDPLRLVDASGIGGDGPFRVELLDGQGKVVRSGAFDLEPVNTGTTAAAMGDAWEPDNLLFWPEFRVALLPHDDAVTLVVREQAEELLRVDLPGGRPGLRFADAGPLRVGTDGATLRWSVEGNQEATFDVEYSPTGQAPWRPLSLGQSERSIALDAAALEPGRSPHLRVTALSGLQADQQVMPVALTGGPVPVRVDLPDPDSALAGVPATVWFPPGSMVVRAESHVQLRDASGAVVPVEYVYLPGRDGLSLLPEQSLRPGETYSVHVTAGLQDRFGNALDSDHRWSFETAAGP